MGPRNERAARVEALVRAHAPDVLAFLTRRVDRPEDAADLLSETLLVVWRRAASLPADTTEARRWMFGVARKTLLRHYRHTTRQRAVADELRGVLAVTAHAGFADPAAHDDLHDAIRRLDTTDRDIIGLVHWEGFSLADAARILGMKEGTVRSRYHRARATLRARLGDAEPGEPAVRAAG